jgi:hypothetical protein
MLHGTVNLAPLLHIIGTTEMPFLLLIRGLLATVFAVSLILAITSVSCVDLMIFLLP